MEILINPRPIQLARLGDERQRYGVTAQVHFIHGYDIQVDAMVTALRIGPKVTPHGVAGWSFDFTVERRGPFWSRWLFQWRRVRHDWAFAEADRKKVHEWRAARLGARPA